MFRVDLRNPLEWWSACDLYIVHRIIKATCISIFFKKNKQLLDKYYLENKDNDEKYSIGSEKYSGLFDRATVAKEGDDEDERSKSY